MLCFLSFSHLCSALSEIIFAWSYLANLSTAVYQPSKVFKKFTFLKFLQEGNECICTKAMRLKNFLDPLTHNENSSFCDNSVHVRTMDINLIQHKGLRSVLAMGLNHIPFHPTHIGQAIAIICDAFWQLMDILKLSAENFPIVEAETLLQKICLEKLKATSNINLYGFRFDGPHILAIPAI